MAGALDAKPEQSQHKGEDAYEKFQYRTIFSKNTASFLTTATSAASYPPDRY